VQHRRGRPKEPGAGMIFFLLRGAAA
jgi:hypothetical protein